MFHKKSGMDWWDLRALHECTYIVVMGLCNKVNLFEGVVAKTTKSGLAEPANRSIFAQKTIYVNNVLGWKLRLQTTR